MELMPLMIAAFMICWQIHFDLRIIIIAIGNRKR